MTQDSEASKGVIAVPRSGGSNMGMRGHNECHLSFHV